MLGLASFLLCALMFPVGGCSAFGAASSISFPNIRAARPRATKSISFPNIRAARPRAQKSSLCSLCATQAQVFSSEVTEYLKENGLDDSSILKFSQALPKPTATCIRVNLLRTTVSDVAESLRDLCKKELGYSPTLYQHPALPECIILPIRHNACLESDTTISGTRIKELPRVLVGRLCGEAVMQGAHVFAPGIAAAPQDLRPGLEVAVYADTTDAVTRGGTTAACHGGSTAATAPASAPLRKTSDVAVTTAASVFVGWGTSRMTRGQVFGSGQLAGRGMAVEMRGRVWEAVPLSGWRQADCMLQSFPAALVARVLDPRAGERVLDMCAAPGGKATHLAQLMLNQGQVVACDRSLQKVKKIQDLASRLELDVVVPTKADASSSLDKGVFEKESFDRVLLDAPCSALGLRPSLRVGGASAWCASKSTTLTARSLTQHVLYQRLMLRQAVKALKPGGLLVFSTCTLNPAENEGNTAWALRVLGLSLVDQTHLCVGSEGIVGGGMAPKLSVRDYRDEQGGGHDAEDVAGVESVGDAKGLAAVESVGAVVGRLGAAECAKVQRFNPGQLQRLNPLEKEGCTGAVVVGEDRC